MISSILYRAALRLWAVAEPAIRRGLAERCRAAAVRLRHRHEYSGAAWLWELAEELER